VPSNVWRALPSSGGGNLKGTNNNCNRKSRLISAISSNAKVSKTRPSKINKKPTVGRVFSSNLAAKWAERAQVRAAKLVQSRSISAPFLLWFFLSHNSLFWVPRRKRERDRERWKCAWRRLIVFVCRAHEHLMCKPVCGHFQSMVKSLKQLLLVRLISSPFRWLNLASSA